MAFDPRRSVLPGNAVAGLQERHRAAVSRLMTPGTTPANVRGVGLGIKWTGGEPTGEPALLVLVTRKVGLDDLARADRLPDEVNGLRTDVLAVGRPVAGAAAPVTEHALTSRVRPVRGGFSIAQKDVTAGTVATAVYDILPGASGDPPVTGIGIPAGYYILSNNHILANENQASIGDPVLQPGPYDGGNLDTDVVATLSRFVPIDLAPDIPVDQHNNTVDAALALIPCQLIDREIHWIGRLRGWRRRSSVNVGMTVQKVGRSSGYTTGRITAINVTMDIGYSAGKSARFHDQFLITPLSYPGDSGSLVTTLDGLAVGLLCAGSPQATVANQIENVRAELGVEVAEQVL